MMLQHLGCIKVRNKLQTIRSTYLQSVQKYLFDVAGRIEWQNSFSNLSIKHA